ncbi:MAG TPA: type II glyceraldehyde-3-phosphate dehydrogenase [Fastidiosipila sp.]|nr:type II glyceraldehyde-3-phosphate dehydrogenase [Fastidiosipila sp.]
MIKVGIAGYGVIGQRLADGVALQKDMELVGIADIAPTLSIRALAERGMPYDLYLVDGADKEAFDKLGIKTAGSFDDLVSKVDVMLDSAPGGVGIKNKEVYKAKGVKAVFQGGEKDEVADVFFHGYANYDAGVDQQFLKLTSCNTTGLIRAVDCLDKLVGLDRVAITIVRRVADPGDYHRGLTNALLVDKAPSHQAVDLMSIMPHIEATGILVHTPVTHGHFITVVANGKEKITKEMAIKAFKDHDRIRVVRLEDGFLGNASLFRYGRDLGRPHGDLYEIAIWEDTIVETGDGIMFGLHIPQESVTIPETIDAIRAAAGMQKDGKEGVAETNKYLNLPSWKK